MKIAEISTFISRAALFVLYFWFGLLKVLEQSPASPLVQSLFDQTIPQIFPALSFDMFLVLFGAFEMLVGLLFIIPRAEKVALFLFFLHMITTSMPLFVLPDQIWTQVFVPTLEGQYIIKNLALIACALSVWTSLSKKGQDNFIPQ
jgi:uncharacterized membrane protein YkgB